MKPHKTATLTPFVLPAGATPAAPVVNPAPVVSPTNGGGEPDTAATAIVPPVTPDPIIAPIPGPTQVTPPVGDTPDPDAPYGREADGTPKKGRGRPRGSHKPRIVNPDAVPPITLTQAVDYTALGGALTDTVTGALGQLIGPEWNPTKPERDNLANCTGVYLRSKNITDIPPGWMLLLAICGYALPRLNEPSTRSKLQSGIHKAKLFLTGSK